MLILGLLGMHFDAAVVFFTNSSLFFSLAMAILCHCCYCCAVINEFTAIATVDNQTQEKLGNQFVILCRVGGR